MKSACLLLSLPLLILAQSYGVSNDGPSSGYGVAPAAAAAYPVPLQAEPFHDILFPPRRRHHHHRRGSRSESRSDSSDSSSGESRCRKPKSKCDRDDKNCCEARVKKDTITCTGKFNEIVQMQDGNGKVIDFGFGDVEVDVKCKKDRSYVRTFDGKKLKVKNVVCYRFGLPAIIDVSAFTTARNTPFTLESFFDKNRVTDAINWSAVVFSKNPAFLKRDEVIKAINHLYEITNPRAAAAVSNDFEEASIPRELEEEASELETE